MGNYLQNLSNSLFNLDEEDEDKTRQILAECMADNIQFNLISSLDLNYHDLQGQCFNELSNFSWPNLEQLYFDQNNMTIIGSQYLSNCPFINLKELSLNSNNIGSAAVRHLANGLFQNLQTLNLNDNMIGSQGVRYLANSPFNLRYLQLQENYINGAGVRYLAQSGFHNIEQLNFNQNQQCPEGLKHLVNSPFQNLEKVLFQESLFLEVAELLQNCLNIEIKILRPRLLSPFFLCRRQITRRILGQ